MQIDTMTVVPADKTIVINGEAYSSCEFTCESQMPQYGAVRAIQWFGNHGQIEYQKGPAIGFPEKTTVPAAPDKSILAPYVKVWLAARAGALRAKHADIVRNAEFIAEHITNQREMIVHLTDQIAALDVQLAEADEATRGGIANAKARLENALVRVRAEFDAQQAAHAALMEAESVADAAAAGAEADVTAG